MEKRNVLQRLGWDIGGATDKWKHTFKSRLLQHRAVQAAVGKRWALVLMAVAFLLGRANILGELAPFAIAFFAAVSYLRPGMMKASAVALVAGSLLSPHLQVGSIAAQIVVFALLQRGLARYEKSEVSHAPALVFLSTFTVGLFADIVATNLTWYAVMMTSVEAALSSVLTLIFLQALPVLTLTRKNYQLRHEEIICLIILLASVLTGTVHWEIGAISLEHTLSRYLILLLAFVGGAPIGASVGVVTGLILSLANLSAIHQISLLAFAGMLAGLLKDGGKMAVGFGMLLGTSILSLYVGDASHVLQSTYESVAAVALFLLTPKGMIRTIAKYVPGTQEHAKSQQDYVRRVRDITANRVNQFSEVFKQLSKSFGQLTEKNHVLQHEAEVGHFVNAVTNEACSTCFKRNTCWEGDFYKTYKFMTDMMTEVETKPDFGKDDIRTEWRAACHKTDRVLGILQKQYEKYRYDRHWMNQIHESRKLVSEQLFGVSQVMDDLVKEIRREGQGLFLQEEQISQVLEEMGLSVHRLDIISLEEGNVEIEIVHGFKRGFDECRKMIAPLLSDVLGETIAVKQERWDDPGEGLSTVRFSSAKEYEIETGIACAAKGGEWLSGDSFSTVELGNGKFAVAVSDGMGNGERARVESSAALSILQQLLQSGMDEQLAIKSVNSVLMLRSSEEMYATVDLAIIDLYSGKTTFMKIGSTPSFIKRGEEVLPITANNLPIGILKDIEVDLVVHQLLPGDLLVMMTDGVYDAPGHAVNKELWMKRILSEMDTDAPQEVADKLLETVIRHHDGQVVDDMTVIAARIDKFAPEWATFRWRGDATIERPRTVS
ncbi:stage II sporulation protein E [Paenibacillus sp.]|uniref:stage II sporulation protein E n=1 Tax=Paenibacillus sp. TaxID=58172 RepID=UPI002D287FF7|nr:stage II sporulation protein E [Paenibacillus sp.]HZG55794.1 stage II sporulation protein E [Paenibacillus sp.]